MLSSRVAPLALATISLIAVSCGSVGPGSAGSEQTTTAAQTEQTAGESTTPPGAERPEPPAETFGVDATVLHQFSLEEQIPELAGLDYRARVVSFEPGAAISEHGHSDRPGLLYVLEGEITEHGSDTSTIYRAGDSWSEEADSFHWAENHTDKEAVVIAVDILETPDEEVEQLEKTGTKSTVEGEAPEEATGVDIENLGAVGLGANFPDAEGFTFRLRRITFEPEGATPPHSHATQPGIGYVLEGDFTEVRPKKTRTLTAGESWFEDAATEHWVKNQTDAAVSVLVFDIVPDES